MKQTQNTAKQQPAAPAPAAATAPVDENKTAAAAPVDENKTAAAAPVDEKKTAPAATADGKQQRRHPGYYRKPVWASMLDCERNGTIRNTLFNLDLILECDEELQGIRMNLLSRAIEVDSDLPWRDLKQAGRLWREVDDAHLMHYIESRFGVFNTVFYLPALRRAADQRRFHPIRDYVKSLTGWDGVPRVETLLVDFLGAEDTPYVRAVTRKLLLAALHRAFNPGVKFDNILVLSGPQGIGKSTLISRLGMGWYSDSLSLSDMNDKTAAEKLQGYWLIEISEMAGMKKADLEKVKSFLTRQDDKYREAYSRRVCSHPRQCVFIGTTNNTDGYLRDTTGNRRFWTVNVTGQGKRKPWELDQAEVDQIWTEAVCMVGEPLTLSSSLERQSAEVQRQSMEHDDREGIVRAYLDTPIPTNWNTLELGERIDWLRGFRLPQCSGVPTVLRDTVSNMEIWCECFRNRQQDLTRRDSAQISAIMAAIEGWKRTEVRQRTNLYGIQRVYRRAEPEETLPLDLEEPGKEAPLPASEQASAPKEPEPGSGVVFAPEEPEPGSGVVFVPEEPEPGSDFDFLPL